MSCAMDGESTKATQSNVTFSRPIFSIVFFFFLFDPRFPSPPAYYRYLLFLFFLWICPHKDDIPVLVVLSVQQVPVPLQHASCCVVFLSFILRSFGPSHGKGCSCMIAMFLGDWVRHVRNCPSMYGGVSQVHFLIWSRQRSLVGLCEWMPS